MIVDLRHHSGIDWYSLGEQAQAEAVAWWRAVRARELVRDGVIDTSGRVRL